ncbi:unnamed protein product [Pseudo-nitzschia multistriata]|uniref:Uncharacterized protein n=1 Tax=Pseudo-nitzschia multistriata TaxID=183589 RepID=A0A448ZKT0_9STRA|nr:unnamed protein product [Pseudo-nitzschia multistriata]
MSLNHRMPAIFTALFSSAAVLTAAFAGASCSFLIRKGSDDDDLFLSSTGSETFGILCEHDFYPREGDKMWELSRIFLILSLTLGSVTAALAWAVASFLTPSNVSWNGISVLAAITAVIQVPIFVLFEAEPCVAGDADEGEGDSSFFFKTGDASCQLGSGSYILMASDLLYVTVTLITQCLDRPRWKLEMDLWKVGKRGQSRPVSPVARNDEYYYDRDENYADNVRLTGRRASNRSAAGGRDDYYGNSCILPAGKARRSHPDKPVGFFAKLFGGSSSPDDDREVPGVPTHSMSAEEDWDYENQKSPDDSQLVLRIVTTNDGGRGSPVSSSPTSVEGQEVSIGAFEKIKAEEDLRQYQVQEEVVQSIGLNAIERHQLIDSPNASFCGKDSIPLQHTAVVSSVNDILEDLHSEELGARRSKSSGDVIERNASSDAVVEGVRKLSKKLKSADSKRRSMKKLSIRKPNLFASANTGYALIDDEESDYNSYHDGNDDKNDDHFLGLGAHDYNYKTDQKTLQELSVMSESTYNPDEFLPQATPESDGYAGANNLQMDDVSSDQDDLDDEDDIALLASAMDWQVDFPVGKTSPDNTTNNPFDCISIGSTHSDPGPVSVVNESFEDVFDFSTPIVLTGGGPEEGQSSAADEIFKFSSIDDGQWESEFANESLLASTDDDYEDGYENEDEDDTYLDSGSEEQRGRSSGRYDGRRRRRPISPVGSIKSNGSLLHTIINEETEEDVERELGVDSPYPIKRTLSCPEQRSFTGPIKNRKEKSTKELLKKLEKLKRTMGDGNAIGSRNRSLPPRSPREVTNTANRPSEIGSTSPDTMDEPESVLEDLLRDSDDDSDSSVLSEASAGNLIEEPESPIDEKQCIAPRSLEQSNPSKIVVPTKKPLKESDPNLLPTKLPTTTKPRKKLILPNKSTPVDRSLDISDETSDTGCTRSTISDSDGSSESGSEAGPRQIRSKSMGRGRRTKKIRNLRASSSLSPTRSTISVDDTAMRPANISSLARESRIRRLQRRKGYLPLDNDNSREMSPSPRDPYSTNQSKDDDDLELTPKRKTVGLSSAHEEAGTDSIASVMPSDLFQPSLDDTDESCPEFDNILEQLDLQLIDLNRPVGAEYGDDEVSL